MAAIQSPSQRLNRIRALIAAQPELVDVIGKTMAWEPIEVHEFLCNQFDVEPAELGVIENAIRMTLGGCNMNSAGRGTESIGL